VYNIRQFKPVDTFAVIKLASSTLTERYNSSLFNYFYETYPQGFIVAEANHKIIGFIIGAKINLIQVKILMIAVAREYRRQKIGRALLTELIKQIKTENIKNVELEVRTDNKNAIEFYKRNNFEIVDRIKKFYQKGEDAYTMRLLV